MGFGQGETGSQLHSSVAEALGPAVVAGTCGINALVAEASCTMLYKHHHQYSVVRHAPPLPAFALCLQFTPTPVPAAAASQLQPLTAELLSYLQVQRCISPAVLVRNRVMSCPHSTGTTTTCSSGSGGSTSGSSSSSSIAFPYFFQGDVLVNIKYRSLDKRFHQVKGGQQVFYGVNDLQVRWDRARHSESLCVWCLHGGWKSRASWLR